MNKVIGLRWAVVAVSAVMLLVLAAACGETKTIEVPGETVIIEKVVTETVEVPGETVVVEKVVTQTIEVPGETVVKEVIKEVAVPGETVVVEVVKEVRVPGETVVVTKEVVKEVAGPERVVEKEVIKVVPAGYVTDPTTGFTVEAPRYGGTITVLSHDWAPATMDPYLSAPQATQYTSTIVLEKLAIGDWAVDRNVYDWSGPPVSPISAIRPNLAESWEISSDNVTYHFKIREGVHFFDRAPVNGRELTAEDVVYSVQRMLGNKLTGNEFSETEPSPHIGTWKTREVESLVATDGGKVVLKMKQPDPMVLRDFVDSTVFFVIPREVVDTYGDMKDWKHQIGTGPYDMVDYVEGSSFTYAKNPNYWAYDEKYPENRLPYADEVKFLFMTEAATKIAAIRTGKIDIQGSLSYALKAKEDMAALRATNPEIIITEHRNRSDYGIGMNTQKAPFDDINVRRAMQMALDLKTLWETYFESWGSWEPNSLLANDTPGIGIPFEEWDEDLKKIYDYNPTEAERLLDEAGYPRGSDGIRLKLEMGIWEGGDVDYNQLVAATYYRDIGVEIKVVPVPGSGWAAYINEQKWDMFAGMTMAAKYGNPMGFMNGLKTGANANRCNCADPNYDALLEAAANAPTEAALQAGVMNIIEHIKENVWFVSGPQIPLIGVHQPWIKGKGNELWLGSNKTNAIVPRIWVDQGLKKAMGY
ncbi:ABC transporter substrate-binding protein [Dehalococcoidia bacterium]|nr:ABC transporter substrate-binding protein [Dehalococcoidia bacterium]